MSRRHTKCCAPNCNTGSREQKAFNKKNGIKNKALFSFPKKDNAVRSDWEIFLGRKAQDEEVLCELHFAEHDINRYYIGNGIKDGSITSWSIERFRPILLETAIPRNVAVVTNIEDIRRIEDELNVGPSLSEPTTSQGVFETTDVEENLHDNEVLITPMVNQHDSFNNHEDQSVIAVGETVVKKTKLTLDKILKILLATKLPLGGTIMGSSQKLISVVFCRPMANSFDILLNIHHNLSISVLINKKLFDIKKKFIKTKNDLHKVLNTISGLLTCDGTGSCEQRYSSDCFHVVRPYRTYNKTGHVRCENCKKERKKLTRLKREIPKRLAKKKAKSDKLRKIQAKNDRLEATNKKLKARLDEAREGLQAIRQERLEELIKKNVDPAHVEMINACISAAKAKGPHGNRYSNQWIYECLLMRIKSPKLYDHLRDNKWPLPHVDTLNKYIKNMGSSYGFNDAVFSQMKAKGMNMRPGDKRGVILIDEMKLSEGITFNSQTLVFDGFVDIGDYTPDHQKDKLGDHALVMMFQPFKGSWVQPLACFLTKGCATGRTLECLILECLSLLESIGFYGDGIVTDAATWNRNVWTRFGVSSSNVSAEHPCDKNRRLWFFSDFPHLIKSLRNKLMDGSFFKTPDGLIKKEHWKKVVHEQTYNKNPYTLNVAHKLTDMHLDPKGYQKMNVSLAYQVFAKSVATAMKIIYENCHQSEECKPTEDFIYRINRLIEIMSIRDANRGLKLMSDEYKFLLDFLDYLENWKEIADPNGFITDSSYHGLKVTIKGTLELADYLCNNHGYEYFMTTRVNQDKLERFFGLARNVCGSNDHPDSILFGQIFRLLCTYSSLKPIKGSNVSGGEMVHSLNQFRKDNINSQDHRNKPDKKEWAKIISGILEKTTAAMENEHEDYVIEEMDNSLHEDISYSVVYVAGYVLRKIIKRKNFKCAECEVTIRADSAQLDKNLYKAINLLNEGGLMYPSEKLIKLINSMEKHILKITDYNSVTTDTLFQVCYSALDDFEPVQLVGCEEHSNDLTKCILDFYFIIRMHFIAKKFNSENKAGKEDSRKHRKLAKWK